MSIATSSVPANISTRLHDLTNFDYSLWKMPDAGIRVVISLITIIKTNIVKLIKMGFFNDISC